MESRDAIAFVNYKYFRSSPENRKKYTRAFFYISKKPRILNLVGNRGRLWIVTSSRKKNEDRIYSLAYKLDKCEPFEVWPHLQKRFGSLGVTADPRVCHHYPRNNLTELLMSLEFEPQKPIPNRKYIGMSLMTARQLSKSDIDRMLEYEDKILHGRHVFISYSSMNRAYADQLQKELETSDHLVWRDVRSIVGGDYWEQEIYRALENADAVVIIISLQSAASDWVKKEISLAKNLLGKPGKLKRIIPLIIDQGAWSLFQNLHSLQSIHDRGDGEGMKRIANELREL